MPGPHRGRQDPPPAPERFSLALEIVIRRCTQADLMALEWFGLFTDHREIIHAAFDRQRTGEVVMLVADLGGFPVGQVWVDFRRPCDQPQGPDATLWAVRVLPPLCGHRIGERLMQAAERLVRERGGRTLSLTVERSNRDARRFYERLGWTESGIARQEYHYRAPDGQQRRVPLDQWVMRKTLKAPPQRVPATGRSARPHV